MVTTTGISIEEFDARRQDLGMSRATLARRSGVSLATVTRILTGREHSPRLGHVQAIARALGVELRFMPVADEDTLRHQRAEEKAREIAGMVQATMGLEAQGVDRDTFEKLVQRNVHVLLSGPGRNLWED